MLDHPSRDGRWTWEHLELLAKALGYQHKIFYDTSPPDRRNEPFLKSDGLKQLLESDVLCSSLHKTFNHQNGIYNLKVLHKSIELLTERYLDFNSLRIARVSFQTYEHTDHAGLEDKTLLRAMSMCGKTMAPLKLKHMLRHMGRLVADRLMLYEFLEVIASGDLIETVDGQLPPMKIPASIPDKHQLYELCDFEDELSTQEQRYYKHLDQKYEDSRRDIEVEESVTECKSPGLTIRPPSEWAIPPLVNQTIRRDMSTENRQQSSRLQKHINVSSTAVKEKAYNDTCTCHDADLSGLSLNARRVAHEDSTVAAPDAAAENVAVTVEVPKVERSCVRRHFAPIVTEKDLKESERRIESLKWDIATTYTQKKRGQRNRPSITTSSNTASSSK